MMVKEVQLPGVRGRFFDDYYADASPEEIARRQALFDRTLRETLREVERKMKEKNGA